MSKSTPIDVLIVDDSPFFTDSVGHFLREHELAVATINDSSKVMDFLSEKKPELLLLDIMMPEVDGISLCRMVKKNENLRDIRIVIFSSKTFETDKELAYQAGAEAFITKDVSVEEIGNQVLKLLREGMKIKFWGTRGSIPTPGPKTVGYGGNTPCVEVNLGGDFLLILDAGSGIRELGNRLLENRNKIRGHIFLSHFHWDHIQGLPFFAPAYSPENQFTIYGCEDRQVKLGKLLSDQMESVYFPVPLRRFGASIQFFPLDEGSYEIESFRLKTVFLNHPSKTLGYRITHRQKSIGYITDNEFITNFTERPRGVPNERFDEYNLKIIEFIRNADVVIIDAQYTREEYQSKKGWGHSHYETVLDITLAANVKKCVLFHHDPAHTDDDMEKILSHCRAIVDQRGKKMECMVAKEGSEIEP
ncbi:MAG: response regulator [Deltaproteobacteria bacterium]|nr:response regulator [Deltaproteobacteria bacterium]